MVKLLKINQSCFKCFNQKILCTNGERERGRRRSGYEDRPVLLDLILDRGFRRFDRRVVRVRRHRVPR